MPSTAVYLVLPASIAWIAASLMLPGVSKSGSPAPSPMTLRPAAFSARALSVTAMVADGFTRSSAEDRKGIIFSWLIFRQASWNAEVHDFDDRNRYTLRRKSLHRK